MHVLKTNEYQVAKCELNNKRGQWRGQLDILEHMWERLACVWSLRVPLQLENRTIDNRQSTIHNRQRTTINCVNENIEIKQTRAMHMNY